MRSDVKELESGPALRAAIDDLNAAYAQTIDDDRLEAWPAFFVEDGNYAIVPRENIEQAMPIAIISCRNRAMMDDRVFAVRKASLYGPHRYRHVISRSLITVSGDQVSGVTPFVVFQMRTDPINFGNIETYALGEYRDRFVRDGDCLKLQSRTVVLDNSTVRTLLATPL